MIPVKYTYRNLRARWVTTVLTACGTGMVVFASVLSFGLSAGLARAMLISADKSGVVCLRKGSLDEVSSGIDKLTADRVATGRGVWSAVHFFWPQYLPLDWMATTVLVYGVLVAGLVGFVSGIVPAVRAAGLSVITGLRKVA